DALPIYFSFWLLFSIAHLMKTLSRSTLVRNRMWSNLMSIDVVSHFTNIRLLADIFNRSSSFDQLNYGDVLMLSETGFMHRDSFVSSSMT
ncbi:hypothetical protein, partial [Salmonella enterica]|uniref:hypothetical protein n=1 Tax=Salmonella enterica TaxID=28901 RepID=UPI003F54521F